MLTLMPDIITYSEIIFILFLAWVTLLQWLKKKDKFNQRMKGVDRAEGNLELCFPLLVTLPFKIYD